MYSLIDSQNLSFWATDPQVILILLLVDWKGRLPRFGTSWRYHLLVQTFSDILVSNIF